MLTYDYKRLKHLFNLNYNGLIDIKSNLIAFVKTDCPFPQAFLLNPTFNTIESVPYDALELHDCVPINFKGICSLSKMMSNYYSDVFRPITCPKKERKKKIKQPKKEIIEYENFYLPETETNIQQETKETYSSIYSFFKKWNILFEKIFIGQTIYNVYELFGYYHIQELIIEDIKYELKNHHITIYTNTPQHTTKECFEMWKENKTSFLCIDKNEAYSYEGKKFEA